VGESHIPGSVAKLPEEAAPVKAKKMKASSLSLVDDIFYIRLKNITDQRTEAAISTLHILTTEKVICSDTNHTHTRYAEEISHPFQNTLHPGSRGILPPPPLSCLPSDPSGVFPPRLRGRVGNDQPGDPSHLIS
jgi:hypothetical protein